MGKRENEKQNGVEGTKKATKINAVLEDSKTERG